MISIKKEDNIFVIGCSSVGAYIGTELSSMGYSVTIIDKSKSALDMLPESYSGFKSVGDGTDYDFLDREGIRKADIVIISTDDDNVNCYIAQYLKLILNIPVVITRIYDEEKAIILKESKVKIIYTTKVIAKEFFNTLSDALIEQEIKEEGISKK